MPELTRQFVDEAIEGLSVWNLGNEVLYNLCAEHPTHQRAEEVMAKVWLIGRAYAAAIERSREETENKGDAFYEIDVIPKIIASDIDTWITQLPNDADPCGLLVARVHKKLTDLFEGIVQQNQRALASKYLHFHKRNTFLIYDSRADKASKEISKSLGIKRHRRTPEMSNDDVDGVYAVFIGRCQSIRERIGVLFGRLPTTRELDQIFLAWCRVSTGV